MGTGTQRVRVRQAASLWTLRWEKRERGEWYSETLQTGERGPSVAPKPAT